MRNLYLTTDIEREFGSASADSFPYLRLIETNYVGNPLVKALLAKRNPRSLKRVRTNDRSDVINHLREQIPDLKIVKPPKQ